MIPTVYLACYEMARRGRHTGPGPLVQISNTAPQWFRGEICDLLVPPWPWVKKVKADPNRNWQGFASAYRERLDATLLSGAAHRLEPLLAREPTLLCWERAGERCHRRIVAEWLLDLGYPVSLDGILTSVS